MAESVNVDRFYKDLVHELGLHALGGGTAIGAAAVAKRVALGHGIEVAASVSLPRPTREERKRLEWQRSEAQR